MNKQLLSTISFLVMLQGFGQAKLRKLPVTINHPAINVSAPYISLDGNSLVFVSDNSDENQLTLFYTTKKDAVNWKEPMMMPKAVNSRLNFLKGFALSPDGKTLYLSSLKSGGLGGFDILVSQLRGSIWPEPTNLGLPINSIGQEASPSLTPDESTIYFMRCEKMDQKTATGCKLLTSRKSRAGQWEEPVELPAYINTGNSQAPRIMGDNETLIFSSDQLPQSKGGMDLYLTKLENGNWSKPVPLTFANTPQDDQYVSAAALGRYLLKDQPGPRTSEIVEILFPPDLKPKTMVKIEGTISGLENPSSAYLAAFNQKNQERVFIGRPEKNGDFDFYLKEGEVYEFTVEPEKNEYTFFSKTYDFMNGQVPISDKIDVNIKQISKGTEIELGVWFEPGGIQPSATAAQSLRMLSRMINGNANRKFILDIKLQGYLTDSVRSSPDLTEVTNDTLHFKIKKVVPDTLKLDSILSVINERNSISDNQSDTTAKANDESFKNTLDSMHLIAVKTIAVDSIAIKRTYHNNRTEAQAKVLVEKLIGMGANAGNLSYQCKALAEDVLEKRKTIVKVIVQ